MSKYLIVLALLLAISNPAIAANLLVNGGFEDPPVSGVPDDPIPGWTMVYQDWVNMRDYHWLVQSDEKYSGNNALEFYIGADPEAFGAGYGVFQTATVTFNKVYEARARWKSSITGGTSSLNFFVFLGTFGSTSPTPIPEPRTMTSGEVFAIRSTEAAWNHPAFLPMPAEWESTKDAPFTPYPLTGIEGTAHFRSRIRALSSKITVYMRVTQTTTHGVTYLDDVVLEEVNAAYSVQGTVKDAANTPVAGATVTCSTGGTATTDAGGFYKIYYPDAGAGTLTISAEHYYDASQPVNLAARADNTVNQTITPKPTGTISGTVTDGSGPVASATVRTTTGGYSTTTNGSGFYTLTVEAGSYTVEASAVGYHTASAVATVTTGQDTTLNIVMTPIYIDPANALTNGDFESGMAPWTEWSATHYSDHYKYDPTCPGYIDQWIGNTPDIRLAPGDGINGSTGIRIGMVEESGHWGASGGVRQECYVVPGRYYRARAMYKGVLAPDATDYMAAVGLINGRFDPGMYTDVENPPPHADDVVMMVAHPDQYYGAQLEPPLPEEKRWWHNIVTMRTMGYNGVSSWDWASTMDSVSPRRYLESAIKQATGPTMTVVLQANMLQWGRPSRTEYVVFDNVVLEEVAGIPPIKLGDLAKVDFSPPYSVFPDKIPNIKVDLSDPANAKVVTGAFSDETSDCFYIEETDRSAGIRVNYGGAVYMPSIGDMVNLTGTLGFTQAPDLRFMERMIVADADSIQSTPGGDLPRTVGITPGRASAKLPHWNPLGQLIGPANTGLLATTWGKVVSAYGPDTVGWSWLQVDDGSGVEFWVTGLLPEPDPAVYIGRTISATGIIGIRWYASPTPAMTLHIREETVFDDFLTTNP